MPTILYAWTSAPGSSLPLPPKKFFMPGEEIQFNVIHQPDHNDQADERLGSYVVTYFYEHLGLYGVFIEESDVELLWPVRYNVHTELIYYNGFGYYHDYYSVRIPTPGTSIRINTREELLNYMQRPSMTMKRQGYWRFTAFVAATDQRTNRWADCDEMHSYYHIRERERWWG